MNPTKRKELDEWLSQEWSVRIPEGDESVPDFSVSVIIPTHRQRPIGLEAFQMQQGVCEVITLVNGDIDLEVPGGRRVAWQGHSRASRCLSAEILFFSRSTSLKGRGCSTAGGRRANH